MFTSRTLMRRGSAVRRVVAGAPSSLPAALGDGTGWKQTFREEFATFSRNSNFSGRDVGQRTPNGTWTTRLPYDETRFLTNAAHNEQQYYADPSHPQNPFSIVNNCLRIQAFNSADTAQSQSKPYVTGMISSDAVLNQLYGYFEVRCKLPEGQGFWPIFWLLSKENGYTSEAYGWPPEIDIMESHGDRPMASHWNVHWYADSTNWHSTYPNDGGAPDHFMNFPGDAANGFHTYGLKWDASKISWWWDGVKIKEVDTPVNMNLPMFMLFTNGIGGEWPNYPDETATFPADTFIDYVGVWSQNPAHTAISAPARLTPTMPATPTAAAATSAPAAAVTPNVTVADNVNSGAASGNRQYSHTDGLKRSYQAGPGNDTLIATSQYGHLYSTPGNGTHTVKCWVNYKLRKNITNLEGLPTTYGLNLTGNASANNILGCQGQDDLIHGMGGDDVITLRGGSNVILQRAGTSNNLTITDFKPGRILPRDRMLLSGYGWANIAAVMAALSQVGSDVVLTANNTGTTKEKITFKNTTLANFNQGNFRCTNNSASSGPAADFGWVDDMTQVSETSLYTTETGAYFAGTGSYGIKFKVLTAGNVTKLKVYKASSGQTFSSLKLWNFTTGALLATAPATTGSEPVGWITLTLTTPVPLTANTPDYMVSYRSNGLSYISGGLGGDRVVAPISAYANFYAESTDIMPATVSNTNSPVCDIVFAS